jgi:hypothetical protein
MKKALLSIAAFTLLATQGFGQAITLGDTSFTTPTGVDSFIYVTSGYGTQPENDVYMPHTNFVWKLNTFSFNATKRRWINHVTATGYDYANRVVDTLNPKTMVGTQPQFTHVIDFLTDITPTGIVEYGRKVPYQAFSLAGLPGANPNDSLRILAQNAMYYQTTVSNVPTTRTKLKLPLTYPGVTWAPNNYQDTIHGRLTYTSAYVDTPFHRKTEVLEQKSVVGYGKMKLNKPNYLGGQSDTLRVLQVRCTLQMKDYYYIDTALAPGALLTNLGVASQGVTRLYYYDEYYRRGYVEPVLTIRMYDGTFTNAPANASDMMLRGLNPVDVVTITNLSSINVYPNPAKGGIINVDINGTQGTWNYNMHNLNGQRIRSGSFTKGSNQIELPAGIAPGNYFILLQNGEEEIVKTVTIAE